MDADFRAADEAFAAGLGFVREGGEACSCGKGELARRERERRERR
jgi:hypothetical protein